MSGQEKTNIEEARERWSLARDRIAFFGGFGIMIYETIAENIDRPWLLVMAIGMMGLPFALRLDKILGK